MLLLNIVVGTHYNHLNEEVLMSIHYLYFGDKKIIFFLIFASENISIFIAVFN